MSVVTTVLRRPLCAPCRGGALRRIAALLLIVGAVAPVLAGPADTIAGVELQRCIALLDPIADVGLERIVVRCPKLVPAIEAASWRVLLPPNWRDQADALSRDGLAALERLVTERDRALAVRAAPDPTQVAAALRAVGALTEDRASRWERFKRWLRAVFERNSADEDTRKIRRWLRPVSVSDAVTRALDYLGYALLVGFAAVVVWGEVKAAGGLRRRSRAAGNATDTLDEAARATAADIARLPLRERPGLLVRLLEHRLVARTPTATTAMLTVRELGAAWPSAARERFAAVGETAERVRFAAEAPNDSELEAAVREGASLLAEDDKLLDSAPVPRV